MQVQRLRWLPAKMVWHEEAGSAGKVERDGWRSGTGTGFNPLPMQVAFQQNHHDEGFADGIFGIGWSVAAATTE